MHSNLLLLRSINHSQRWLLQWQDKNRSLPAAPAPGLLAAISPAWRQAWTLSARVPPGFAKIQLRVCGNSEASREVFNTFLITFRDVQKNCRLKPCEKGQLGAVKMRRDWLQRDQGNWFCCEWFTAGAGERGRVFCCSCLSQGMWVETALCSIAQPPPLPIPEPQGHRERISQCSFIPRGHLN